jgi:hypothetical protein
MSGELIKAGVLTSEFKLIKLEEIIKVIVSIKVVNGLLIVKVVISTSGGVLAKLRVITSKFGLIANVERIIKIIVFINVINSLITIKRVV